MKKVKILLTAISFSSIHHFQLPTMGSELIKILFFSLHFICFFNCSEVKTYRAAVYEASPAIHSTYEGTIEENLRIYEQQITLAAQQGVQIIAFPEYGLTSLKDLNQTRESVKQILPFVYDPVTHPWNPCEEPNKFPQSEVLRRLSCASKANSIVVLANILTQALCNISGSPSCRPDGISLRNSNLVFAANGSFLALYHKSHLFDEEQELDPSENEKPVIFDAGFAKFGSFICFDMAWSHPAVQYVKELGIKNIVFSTAWAEELPFLTAIQYFNAWAQAQGVNFLASNMYSPDISRLGSGIFSAGLGALNYTYDISKPNRLIIADVPLNPGEGSISTETYTFFTPDEKLISAPYGVFTNLPSSEPTTTKLLVFYQNLAVFNYTFLDSNSGQASVCQGDACCNLTYAYAEGDEGTVRHALIARDGPHPFGKYNWSAEICAVVRCESSGEIETCGRVPKNVLDTAKFSSLELDVSVSADLLYPHIIAPNLQLPARNAYKYTRTHECPGKDANAPCSNAATLQLREPTSLLTFAIYGKFYSDYKVK